ncbi:uracil catabolism 4 [Fusarium beomiforme]|uniref:Uracil catabolism 4 n=1 Tax=Fusarium beomiforme TaxID=44412 RepID=A0A9P5DU11_9HYPO|nr:uracil catabolism 4 [Fusarium beomiforme]
MISQLSELKLKRHDLFESITAETNAEIVKSLTLEDLLSLTRASPAAWRHFRRDHAFILKQQLLLIRLRLLRTQLRGKPGAEVEKRLRPFVDSVLFLDFIDIPFDWDSTLPIVVAATNLRPELRGVFEK